MTISAFALILGLSALALAAFTQIMTRRIEARYPVLGVLAPVVGGHVHVVIVEAKAPWRGDVVLIHGASGNCADMIGILAPPLSLLGFRVFAVDRPGHGWSSRLAGRAMASPQRQAQVLRAALQNLGVRSALIVGHSLGAVSALALALDAPESVDGLVLLSPVSHPWPGGVSWYYDLAALPLLGAAFCRLFALPGGLMRLNAGVAAVFAPNRVPENFIEATRVPLLLRPAHFEANAQDVAATKKHVTALCRRYREIDAPTNIVSGDHDAIVYTHIHSLGCQRDIKGAALKLLAGVGHSPHHTDPHAVIEAIVDVARRAMRATASSAPPLLS